MIGNRSELIKRFVLNAIADDFENLEQITKDVTNLSGKCGLTITSSEIVRGLGCLIETGLAKAYRLYASERPPDEISSLPPAKDIDHYYFGITEKGMSVQLSDYDGWPFDEQNVLRKGWAAPTT